MTVGTPCLWSPGQVPTLPSPKSGPECELSKDREKASAAAEIAFRPIVLNVASRSVTTTLFLFNIDYPLEPAFPPGKLFVRKI